MLPPDLIADVGRYLSLSSIARLGRACSSWHTVTQCKRLWDSVLRRQWHLGQLGAQFPGGSREFCRCVCYHKDGVWCPRFDTEQGPVLAAMSPPAEHFLFGIAHGYVPTSDGLFTYHGHGAKPIHYRHNPAKELPQYTKNGAVRIGGRWEWSPDRESWFGTETCELTRGRFASRGWRLVADNVAIVNFLERWPIIPLIASELTLGKPAAVTTHAYLNLRALGDFLHAVGKGPLPTTSCVATNMFTIHFHFVPALQIE
eukprot:gb/GFBE01001556.1/.p1 GENE.gb/GFBE01001556.1/~~gb/GFBE01001556.1/.p1  ORF type:complete len:257 (+),score=13.23 gb/GFBE01001556.1/:1-771(+)